MTDSKMDIRQHVIEKAQAARHASVELRTLSSGIKDAALKGMAEALVQHQEKIFAANQSDLAAGRERGLSEAMLDRLQLNEKRVQEMAEGCRQVAALPDPIGEVISGWRRPNGLKIEMMRVPLGVVGIIYESRPNVTVDAAILCLKSGNAAVLRGGSEAIHSNRVLAEIISQAAVDAGAPKGCIELIETTDRSATSHLATLNDYIDLIIPRGGETLKKALSAVATVPLIFAAGGVCHTFIDQSADLSMAADIAFNAKVQRPSTCNALETLLVHEKIAPQFLPLIAPRFIEAGVELRGDEASRALIPQMAAADADDWDTEYNGLVLTIGIVPDLNAGIEHINRHGTGHSDAIITEDYANAEEFCARIDAAALYVNASTRFTDGYEFGLGAEIGISTQKLHARGPLGLEALTSTKYIVRGQGQIRS